MSLVSTCSFVITGAEYAEGEVEGGCGLTGGVILLGVISFLSRGGCTGEKQSRSADFWLPFLLSREVVHGVRVVCWVLSDAMPVMEEALVVVVSRG